MIFLSDGTLEKPDRPKPPPTHSRYQSQGIIGSGGGGDIHRVFDVTLRRVVAMKVLRRSLQGSLEAQERFRSEACICASLEHPAIVPVYDFGMLPDGRPFIVMPVISGETLSVLIEQAHRREGGLEVGILYRLISFVRTVCEAIAFAHKKRVLHRDLKPGNVMIGEFGEVRVLDWGLAGLQRHHQAQGNEDNQPSDRTTRHGDIFGTLGYMPPEQARGEHHLVDARTDVFALGAVLHEVLTGMSPWGSNPAHWLHNACVAKPITLRPQPGCPEALVRICQRALMIEPEHRYQSAADLAGAIGAWLDGVDALRRAREQVELAEAAHRSSQRMMAEGDGHEERSQSLLKEIATNAPEQGKWPAWAAQDRAEELRHQARLGQTQRIQHLLNALSHVSDMPEANNQLAGIYVERHQTAEQAGARFESDRLEFLIRQHNAGRYDDYLRGVGWLTLRTSRPARVTIYQYQEQHRRLIGACSRQGLTTPLIRLELPIGSYVAELQDDSGLTFRYPLSISRGQEVGESGRIWMPDSVPDGMVYVPAGSFWSGGDEQAPGVPLPGRTLWVDGFFISISHVTNRSYIEYLDDLVAMGLEEVALSMAPRERPAVAGQVGRLLYCRTEQGGFGVTTDGDGHRWDLDWPVVMISHIAASAFALWRSHRTGLPYRLPYELEWEKAARGSGDQRNHVWGTDALDPTWCRLAASTDADCSAPVAVGSHCVDESPYGVQDLAGNATDLCADHYRREGPLVIDGRWEPLQQSTGRRTIRGGHWGAHPAKARICWRGGLAEGARSAVNSFRLVLPVPEAR